jgi:hypothetical protein
METLRTNKTIMNGLLHPYSPPLDNTKLSKIRPAVDRPAPAKSSFGRASGSTLSLGRTNHPRMPSELVTHMGM